jgi:hypothetical protein
VAAILFIALNSLLNKPLYRAGITPAPRLLRPLLQLLIGGQWVLAVGSCALQDWNALLISFWLAFCVCASTYAYPPESGVQDWLQYHCNLSIRRVQAEFSSRRSMLSAMLYLNPDSKERRTDWITPLLASSDDRKEWESALLDYIHTGMSPLFICHIPYCSTPSVYASKGSFLSILYHIPSCITSMGLM